MRSFWGLGPSPPDHLSRRGGREGVSAQNYLRSRTTKGAPYVLSHYCQMPINAVLYSAMRYGRLFLLFCNNYRVDLLYYLLLCLLFRPPLPFPRTNSAVGSDTNGRIYVPFSLLPTLLTPPPPSPSKPQFFRHLRAAKNYQLLHRRRRKLTCPCLSCVGVS